jgi:hypothetical protein
MDSPSVSASVPLRLSRSTASRRQPATTGSAGSTGVHAIMSLPVGQLRVEHANALLRLLEPSLGERLDCDSSLRAVDVGPFGSLHELRSVIEPVADRRLV